MRTTVDIDEHVLLEVKTVAATSGRTMSAVIEDAIRQALIKRHPAPRRPLVTLMTHDGGGLQPGVDLDDTSALLDLMDAHDR
ncbi:MAG TPA: CopG family transcriptional regulator [Candidatus Limnocylindrales bacterium]|nr:CopG family transcriptional regulator [Candidatus Limnocylindrales bacterium]